MARAKGGTQRCKSCGKTFRSKKELSAHVDKAHGAAKSRILIHQPP